jgi:hypothetical protein
MLARAMLFGSAVLVLACAHQTEERTMACLTVPEVLARTAQLADQEVLVCGFLKYEFEDENLYSTRAVRESEEDEGQCLSVGRAAGTSLDLLPSANNREVLVRGIVRTDACPDGYVCPASCSDQGIFVSSVQTRS